VIKRLTIFFRPYRKAFLGSIACVMAECVFELVIPLIMADIIDVGVVHKDRSYILQRGALMVACALTALVLGSIYARLGARAGQGFGAELRQQEYKRVQEYSFSNLDHFSTPSLITRLTSDITILQNSVCNGIRPMVRGPVMMLTGLVMSIVLNPKLSIVFLVAVPVLAAGLYLIMRTLGASYTRMQKMLDRVNSIVQENLTAIRTVKSYVRGESQSALFAEGNGDYCAASEHAFHTAMLNMPYFQLIMYTTILCILWFGGNFIHAGTMKVGQLTGFLSYVLQILNSLMMISNVFLMLSRSMTSISRVFEVLDEKPEIIDSGDPSLVIRSGSVDFENVSFKYSKNAKEDVLSDVSLNIGAGQMIGVLGGTGAAKTSLVQLIPRLYDVSAGCVRIDGHDVREYSLRHLRDSVGMVLQNNTLFSGTIRENLLWGNEHATQEELDWACRIACADEFLGRLPDGYNTVLGQGGVNVSGGQKQRLCIARALLKRPKILILDDSTSAVDTATERRIRERLTEGLPQTTRILITQRLGSVEEADQIILLDDGKVTAVGRHDELLANNEVYREIWQFQQKGEIA
jgi:ATP-binding cassette subfamily B protein